jgi:hypothetical protein
MKKGIYLGKHGKIYGPFSGEEFEKFHETGKIYEFTWIWDESLNNWKSLDPAPTKKPPIYVDQVKAEKQKDNVVSLSAEKALKDFDSENSSSEVKTTTSIEASGYQALCHNFRFAVSGEVSSMTETSCELKIELSAGRVFPKNTDLLLNIYDPSSGKSVNVKAKLIDSVREGNNWLYHMRWQTRPDFEAPTAI